MNNRLKKSCCFLLTAVTVAMSAISPVMAAGTTIMKKTEIVLEVQEDETNELEVLEESEESLISEVEIVQNEAISESETQSELETDLESDVSYEQTNRLTEESESLQNDLNDEILVTVGELEVESELEQFKVTKDMGDVKVNQHVNGIFKKADEDIQRYTFVSPSSGYYQIEAEANIKSGKDITFRINVDGFNADLATDEYIDLWGEGGYDKNIKISEYIPQNTVCFISIYLYGNDLPDTVSYSYKIKKVETTRLKENKIISMPLKPEGDKYLFVPEKSGVYELSLSGASRLMIGPIYDNKHIILSGIYTSDDNKTVALKCEKGMEYYFFVKDNIYGLPTESINYTIQAELMKSYKSFFYKQQDGNITISGYIGNESTVIIPASIEGMPVTRIGEHAFEKCKSITKVDLPNSIEYIEFAAFYDCTSLEKITVPDSVRHLGIYAFRGCKSLESAILNGNIKYLSSQSFFDCTKLKRVTLPNGLSVIEAGAFGYCSSLTDIVIPESVNEIQMNAFDYCTKLKKLTLPSNLKKLGAFRNCTSLETITIPETVTEIGGFSQCTKLKKIVLPPSAKVTMQNAFSYCTNLESVTIQGNVKFNMDAPSINNPFSYCPKLKTITVDKNNKNLVVKDGMLYTKIDNSYYLLTCLSGKSGTATIYEGTKWIAEDAFEGCARITTISIPASADLQDDRSSGWATGISYLENLKSVTLDTKSNICKLVNGALYSKDGKILYWYPKNASGKVKIPEGVTTIKDYAFRNHSKITEISLPSTLKTINNFEGCSSLVAIKVDSKSKIYKSINGVVYSKDGKILCKVPPAWKGVFKIPKGTTKVDGAFDYCHKITKIEIPSSVSSVGTNGFIYSDKLEAFSVDRQNKTFSSKDGVLYDKKQKKLLSCPSNIKYVTIPSTVMTLGTHSFGHCPNLSKLVIPSNVTELENRVAYECKFDVYFEGSIPTPYGRGQIFYGDDRPIGYYDESRPEWKAAIGKLDSEYGLLGITKWKKAEAGTTSSSIKLNTSTLTMVVSATATLKATVSNVSNTTITWSTSDKSIATVSSKGVVTAKSVGKATITAKYNGKSAKCTVTVNPANPKLKKAASAEKGKIKITWEKAAGAGGYIIYKKSGDSWKKLETVKSSITSYTDKGLTSGKKYTYTVKAYKTVSGTTYTSDFDKTGVSAKVK